MTTWSERTSPLWADLVFHRFAVDIEQPVNVVSGVSASDRYDLESVAPMYHQLFIVIGIDHSLRKPGSNGR